MESQSLVIEELWFTSLYCYRKHEQCPNSSKRLTRSGVWYWQQQVSLSLQLNDTPFGISLKQNGSRIWLRIWPSFECFEYNCCHFNSATRRRAGGSGTVQSRDALAAIPAEGIRIILSFHALSPSVKGFTLCHHYYSGCKPCVLLQYSSLAYVSTHMVCSRLEKLFPTWISEFWKVFLLKYILQRSAL